MKIATVTLNPAIDQTVRADHFRANAVNRGQGMRFDAGGKGVNVASFLADAGYATAVTGFLGAENASIFEQFFARKSIDDQFVRIAGETRIGVKIVDEVNQQTTDINMPGLTPPQAAIETLLQRIEGLASTCDWFVLAGALPPGAPTVLYATIIDLLKRYSKPMALDTSGDALHAAVQAGPTILKPNIDELQQLTGKVLATTGEIEAAARGLLTGGTRLVVISMGERGALFVDQATTLLATPPSVAVKSTVGAGDAMVAGLIAGQARGMVLADCARLATAFALGAITRVGAHLPDAATLQAYVEQVTIQMSTDVSRSA